MTKPDGKNYICSGKCLRQPGPRDCCCTHDRAFCRRGNPCEYLTICRKHGSGPGIGVVM